MLLWDVPPPVFSMLNAAQFVIEPDLVHAVAAWSAIATFAEREPDALFVPLYTDTVWISVVDACPPPVGLLYLNTGCVIVWDSEGVFATIVCAWPCWGTEWLCEGN